MPWSQTSPMDQRTQFIADYLRQVLSITELCNLYGVLRKTAYRASGGARTCQPNSSERAALPEPVQ